MNIPTKVSKTLSVILTTLILSIVLTSCSDDKVDNHPFDHAHPKTIDLKKHLFEHEFAGQCVSQKTANLVDKEASRERLTKSCMCIATYLFKDLAAKQSYSLLNDKTQAQALRKRYKEANKHCL